MKNSFQIDDATLAQLVKEVINASPQETEPVSCLGSSYIGLRQNGVLLRHYWLDEGELFSTLQNTLSQDNLKGVDGIELCLTYHYRRVPIKHFKRKFPNIKRGIRGIEFQYQSQVVRFSPTTMIAENLSFKQVFKSFLQLVSLSAKAFEQNGGIIQAFEARQVFVSLVPSTTVAFAYRGNQIVPLEEISSQTISNMAEGMGSWLLGMSDSSDNCIYEYLPSQDIHSKNCNLTSQLMTTLSLIRYAKFTSQPTHLTIADRQLKNNLVELSEINSQEHLDAYALAGLAILEHPQNHCYREKLLILREKINTLWQEDGSLAICQQSPENNDFEKFEPGKVLLLWAYLYKINREQQLLQQCWQSFFSHQHRHRANRHPASIPWHTQAYGLLFDATGNPMFRDFIFELNDWLLSLQQWDNLSVIDARGRFYDPEHREYGSVCSATTALYLQSLVEAYRLAVQNQDLARANTYELAIWRGLRNIRQLQFKDDVDMFYIKQQAQVRGAVRRRVYDNRIRIDNVQQSLIALLKLSELPQFPKQAPQPRSGFRLIEQQVDIAPLMVEINNKSALWFYDTSRQKKLAVQQETNSIFLRRATKPFPAGITNARDVHDSCPTEIAQEFPVIMNFVEQFVQKIGGELGRINIVRLAPKGRVYSHIDRGEYYRVRDRYHLVLQSRDGSWLKCGKQEVRMQEGELWWFDNKQLHESFNASDQWRIHLIFDILPEQVIPDRDRESQSLNQTAEKITP